MTSDEEGLTGSLMLSQVTENRVDFSGVRCAERDQAARPSERESAPRARTPLFVHCAMSGVFVR